MHPLRLLTPTPSALSPTSLPSSPSSPLSRRNSKTFPSPLTSLFHFNPCIANQILPFKTSGPHPIKLFIQTFLRICEVYLYNDFILVLGHVLNHVYFNYIYVLHEYEFNKVCRFPGSFFYMFSGSYIHQVSRFIFTLGFQVQIYSRFPGLCIL